MTYQVRMLAPMIAKSTLTHQNGKQINDAPGTCTAYDNHIADFLDANGYTRIAITGTTAQRPVAANPSGAPSVYRGMSYYDTTLAALIVYDGLNWRSPVSGSVV